MGKPFSLRLKPTSKSRYNVLIDVTDMKSKQLEETVEWCQVNKKHGWAAINSGKFQLIKDLWTVIETGKEKEYCSIFTKEKEESLVYYQEQKQVINWVW